MENKGWVYLIGSSVGLCKIGISENPHKRFADLQNANAAKLQLLGSVQVDDAISYEARLHEHHDNVHNHGEWFKLVNADITKLLQTWQEIVMQAMPPNCTPAPTTNAPPLQFTINVTAQDDSVYVLSFKNASARRVKLFAQDYLKQAPDLEYPLAEKHWIGSGKIWSNGTAGRYEWGMLRDQLLNSGLAENIDKQRWQLTSAGTQALQEIADSPAPNPSEHQSPTTLE